MSGARPVVRRTCSRASRMRATRRAAGPIGSTLPAACRAPLPPVPGGERGGEARSGLGGGRRAAAARPGTDRPVRRQPPREPRARRQITARTEGRLLLPRAHGCPRCAAHACCRAPASRPTALFPCGGMHLQAGRCRSLAKALCAAAAPHGLDVFLYSEQRAAHLLHAAPRLPHAPPQLSHAAPRLLPEARCTSAACHMPRKPCGWATHACTSACMVACSHCMCLRRPPPPADEAGTSAAAMLQADVPGSQRMTNLGRAAKNVSAGRIPLPATKQRQGASVAWLWAACEREAALCPCAFRATVVGGPPRPVGPSPGMSCMRRCGPRTACSRTAQDKNVDAWSAALLLTRFYQQPGAAVRVRMRTRPAPAVAAPAAGPGIGKASGGGDGRGGASSSGSGGDGSNGGPGSSTQQPATRRPAAAPSSPLQRTRERPQAAGGDTGRAHPPAPARLQPRPKRPG